MSERKPAWLKNLLTTRIALVDSGANPEAEIVLFKSLDPEHVERVEPVSKFKKCPECGNERVEDDAKFCMDCGFDLAPSKKPVAKAKSKGDDMPKIHPLEAKARSYMEQAAVSGRPMTKEQAIVTASEIHPELCDDEWRFGSPVEPPVQKSTTPVIGGAAWSAIEKAADDIQKQKPNLSRADAIVEATEADPKLAAEYRAEARAIVG